MLGKPNSPDETRLGHNPRETPPGRRVPPGEDWLLHPGAGVDLRRGRCVRGTGAERLGETDLPMFLSSKTTSMRRKIASRGVMLLFPEVFRSHGGIQNVCRDQVQALRRLRPTPPISVMVLNDSPIDVENAEWHGVAASGFSKNKIVFSGVSVGRAMLQRPAILLLGHRGFLPLAPILKAASPSTSIWMMVYGIDAWPHLNEIERVCLSAVARVHAISPDTKRRFHEAGFQREVELLPIGLPHYWRLEDPSFRRFDPPVHLLAVARLWASEKLKGIDHTIKAVALMRRRGVGVVFDVVGAGDDLNRLMTLADSLNVSDSVRFHGGVSEKRLAELYRGANIFVLPSGSEGFGLVFLEAMAFGKPVVAADVAGAPFVVRPGESGCLVPYGDPSALSECLEGLIRDPERARELGRRGRVFLEHNFTFDQYSRRFLAIMELLPEDNRESAPESNHPMFGREI